MVDLDKIAAGLNPSGIDPVLEAKANEYGKRSWQMDFKPVLVGVFGEEWLATHEVALQNALFSHKVSVLENLESKELERAATGKRW